MHINRSRWSSGNQWKARLGWDWLAGLSWCNTGANPGRCRAVECQQGQEPREGWGGGHRMSGQEGFEGRGPRGEEEEEGKGWYEGMRAKLAAEGRAWGREGREGIQGRFVRLGSGGCVCVVWARPSRPAARHPACLPAVLCSLLLGSSIGRSRWSYASSWPAKPVWPFRLGV